MAGYSIFAGTLADMTWPEVEAAGARDAPLLVPVAVIEQHSHHLPLATDTYGAYLLCSLIQKDLATRASGAHRPALLLRGQRDHRDVPRVAQRQAGDDAGPCSSRSSRTTPAGGCAGSSSSTITATRNTTGPSWRPSRHSATRACEATYFLGGMIQGFVDAAYQGTFHQPLPLTGDAVLRSPESEATRAAHRPADAQHRAGHPCRREGDQSDHALVPRDHGQGCGLSPSLAPVPETAREFQEAEAAGRWRDFPGRAYRRPGQGHVENGELYALEAADMAAALAHFLAALNRGL